MIRLSQRKIPIAAFFGLAIGLMLGGCAVVSFNQRLLVKVHTKDGRMEVGPKGDGWHFRHLAQAPRNSGEWYIAYRVKDGHEVEEKHALSLLQLFGWRWRTVHKLTPIVAEAAHASFKSYPLVVEPSFVFYTMPQMMTSNGSSKPRASEPESPQEERTGKVDVTGGPVTVWPMPKSSNGNDTYQHPKYDPVWWKGAEYTQLDGALAEVEARIGRHSHVKIGFVDTGFDGHHVAVPKGPMIVDSPDGDADGWAHGRPLDSLIRPGSFNETHALGTLGLLAGGQVEFKGYDSKSNTKGPVLEQKRRAIFLGGAPHSVVVAARVASSPISLETAGMAYAIDYASRREHCDVITMSHGGAPTLAWADAINAAYERGTAIFAAEGDWFRLSPEIFGFGVGFPLPRPFYPAGFRRVIGVTGATSDQTNYAVHSFFDLFGRPWKSLNLLAWALRGSYGPDGWSGMWKIREDPQLKGFGDFRAWPIAAYAPNTMWLQGTHSAELSGGGTSAATPQVAAAAALWLDYNRDQIARDWRTWRKAEAVYQALLYSSFRRSETKPDRYLGAGILKAKRALTGRYDYRHISSLSSMRTPVPVDTFDARKSFRWLLFGKHSRAMEDNIAQLDQAENPPRGIELVRMYYNSLLLEKWHRGVLPYKDQEPDLWRKAEKLAARQLSTRE